MSEACLKDAVLQIDIGVKSKWHIPLKNAPSAPDFTRDTAGSAMETKL